MVLILSALYFLSYLTDALDLMTIPAASFVQLYDNQWLR